MNLVPDIEVCVGVVTILGALSAGIVWAIQKLLKAGAWFAAISANTEATQSLSKEIGQLRDMIFRNASQTDNNTKRIDELEKKVRDSY